MLWIESTLLAEYTINFLLDHASWPTEWQMHMVLMAWDYYMHTGDADLLRDRYEDIKRKSLIALTDDNGLISTRTGKKTQEFLNSIHYPGPIEKFRDNIDWPHGAPKGKKGGSHRSPLEGGETDGYVFTDYNTVINAFHNRSLSVNGQYFRSRWEIRKITNSLLTDQKNTGEQFLAAFLNEDTGYFTDGSRDQPFQPSCQYVSTSI